MAYLRHQEAQDHFRDHVLAGLKEQFPMEGRLQSLHLEHLEVEDSLHPDDIRSQHQAKLEGQTWAAPVYATLMLKDNRTGEVVDRKRMKIAEIPQITRRYSYIVGGKEYQIDNQWQLKPGIYTQRKHNGELATQFNILGKSPFDISFHPDTKQFVMEYHDSKLPLYPFMKAMGVSDEQLEKTWGKEVLDANRSTRRVTKALDSFVKTTRGWTKGTIDPEQQVRQVFSESRLNPDATELTVGKRLDRVTGEALQLATDRLLKVQRGAKEDDRDSIVFKQLRSIGDYAYDTLRGMRREVKNRVDHKLNSARNIRDILKFETINTPFKTQLFSKNAAARVASQINPAEMVSSSMQTTILGPGGIQSEDKVTEEAKLINPSHFGFIDPISTPEGGRTGITLRLAAGVRKVGNEAKIPLYNLKTGKVEEVDPKKVLTSKIVLADQVRWSGDKPVPLQPQVKMMGMNNEPTAGPMKDADYVMRRPSHFLSLTTNLIPFVNNTNGARAGYASRHIEQAISLVNREAPLVQSGTGIKGEIETFDKLLGSNAAHRAPVAGTVVKVEPDHVLVKDVKGKTHEVQLYNHFPLNDAKSMLHSEPLVKVGDKVKEGQVVADTNFSKNGVLALGTNLRVGFLPYKGYNFEDGLVISQSAAQKLTSQHMHKHELKLADTIIDPKRYRAMHAEAFTRDQYGLIGDDGVVKVGAKLKPGDPLVIAMKPYQLRDVSNIAKMRKSLAAMHTDASLRWDGEGEGEVVAVHRNKDKIQVHVRTSEGMQIGDKMCFDEATEVLTSQGWKPISEVTLEDEVCSLADGKIVYVQPEATHRYDRGGTMYRIKNQQLDLFVTENHRMYVQRRGRDEFELLRASEVFGKRVRYKKDGIWEGNDPEYVEIGELTVKAGQGGVTERSLPAIHLNVKSYMMLLGAYLSNGSSFLNEKHSSYGVKIDTCVGPKFDVLQMAVKAAGFHACTQVNGNAASLVINSKQLAVHFRVLGHAKEKHIPSWVFSLSKDALRELLKWLMWGDGYQKNGRYVSCSTVSKRLADDIQRLCLHVGYAANIKQITEDGYRDVNGVRCWCAAAYLVSIVTTKLKPQVNHGHVENQKVQEEYWLCGYEQPVYCVTVPSHVLYVRRNGKPVWSGNSNRFGGKGIVTAVLPDEEMPRTKDGKPIDVAFNCSGIPGRMNIGQVLEVAASKIAQKTGKTYVVESFEPGSPDTLHRVQKELKHHGLSDTEELFDPVTGKSLGPVLVGPQHMLKLVHQVDKKISVRPGMSIKGVQREPQYSTSTLQPVGGGHVGGQSIGSLGVYALLAHGARANLREFQSYKSEGMTTQVSATKGWPSQHREIWAAIQQGTPLPPPKPTFAFHKFENMLKGAGINIEKKGHNFVLGPLTDKQILAMSAGEIKDPTKVVMSKVDEHNEPKPLAGGLFDEKITGGNGGVRWSHIKLSEPLPNPVFEGPIKHLTGLKGPDFEAIIYGQKAVSADGKVVPLGHGVTGGAGIKSLLDRIDVDRDLKHAQEQLKRAPESKVDKALKQVKYLQALKELGAKPSEAYMLHYLPVLPPSSRPITVLPNGAIRFEDINGLYKQFGTVNAELGDKDLRDKLSDKRKKNLRNDFYDGVKAIMGVHIPYAQNKIKGLLHTVSGSSPKNGYFQNILVERKQDLTMRSTIVPEPALGLDEVGLPKHAALELFAPFVVRKLVELGGAKDPLEAQKKLGSVINGSQDSLVWKALEKTMDERPVLLKRDPALHSYSVQAFKAKAVGGSAIKIHPLVCSGFSADFDGDTMSVYVPITGEAVHEARKMHPSNNLFAEASGKLAYQPSHESIVGLYKLTSIGDKTNHKFDNIKSALDALGKGGVKYNDVVTIGGKPSTPGRALVASVLPEPMQAHIAHNMDLRLDTKSTGKLLTQLAKEHGNDFGVVVNKVKDLGNHAAFGVVTLPGGQGVFQTGAHTLSLKDFEADKVTRDTALKAAADKIKTVAASKNLTSAEKEHKAIQAWEEASTQMQKAHEAKMQQAPNNLFLMHQAGVKPGWAQYKQMALAPMLMRDSQGKVVPMPVTRSYGEGLDISGYWTHLHGTRRGTVKKVQEVQDPGYLTKLMQNTAMHLHVVHDDCGTSGGVSLHVSDPEAHDRVLQQDFKSGAVHIPAGTVLSPDVVGVIRSADKNAQLVVRSPLRCEADQGLCAKCMGLAANGHFHPVGAAVGVQAVHALGERAVQLTLKEFHTSGVTGVKGMTNSMDRLEQLTKLPERIPAAATLAMSGGKIDKIERDATGAKVWIGGVPHHVGKDRFGRSLAAHEPGVTSTVHDGKPWHPPAVGMTVEAGHVLSDPTRTIVNPRDVFKATGSIEKFQKHLSNEIFNLYRDEGVKRKHVEVLVKAMTSGTKVKDPGDSHLLRGEVYPLAQVQKLNQNLKGKRPIAHEPVIEGVTMLPHHLIEDWMAKLQHDRLRDTILDAAATLGKSSIHGVHPIPGLAYGAEFGRTSADAKKPGLGHLHDVPEHHY